MKVIIRMALFLLSVYLAAGACLYAAQRSFIYFPTEVIEHPYVVERFSHEGESLEVIVLNEGNEKAILYFGGNAEPVALGAADISVQFPDHTAYLMNYRGYAGSTGMPSEQGLYGDALHLYDEIKKRHKHVVVSGRSLGTGIATLVASSREVSQLVLITPYDSIRSLAQGRFPLYPMSLLLKDQYDSLSRAENIESDILVLLAETDRVIPKKYSDRLINALSEQPSRQGVLAVKTIANSGHNDLSNHKDYYGAIRDFLGY